MLAAGDILQNGEIYIPKFMWDFMNEAYEKEDIRQFISNVIRDYSVPLPIKKPSYSQMQKDFKNLCKLDCREFLKKGETKTRYEYDYMNKSNEYYLSFSNIGLKSSDYFHYESRMECDHLRYPGPTTTWNCDRHRFNTLGSLWSMNYEEINTQSLKNSIVLRQYMASQYRPSVAKTVYSLFNSRNVLDFSCGWGDRLAGFYATNSTRNYYGFDPNSKLHEGYEQQAIEYSKGRFIKKNSFIVCSPAEDGDYNFGRNVDTIFTSPPYFNTEIYSTEESQSWKKYENSFDGWLNGFLLKTIEKSWNILEDNGVMIINITDVFNNHNTWSKKMKEEAEEGEYIKENTFNVCGPMNEFISTLTGAEYLGCLGMRMSKRPNSGFVNTDDKTPFVEPMWVWAKNPNQSLDDYVKKFLTGT